MGGNSEIGNWESEAVQEKAKLVRGSGAQSTPLSGHAGWWLQCFNQTKSHTLVKLVNLRMRTTNLQWDFSFICVETELETLNFHVLL